MFHRTRLSLFVTKKYLRYLNAVKVKKTAATQIASIWVAAGAGVRKVKTLKTSKLFPCR